MASTEPPGTQKGPRGNVEPEKRFDGGGCRRLREYFTRTYLTAFYDSANKQSRVAESVATLVDTV